MKKEVKIILYCVLGVILIVALCLFLWQSKNEAWEADEITEEQEMMEIETRQRDNTQQPSWNFEEDVMNDLESFFNDNNWYENIQWEFWFVSNN